MKINIQKFKREHETLFYIVSGIIIAFVFSKFLAVVLATNYPVVAVVSESMQHDNPNVTHYQWLEKNLGYNKSYIDSWPIAKGFKRGDMPIVKGDGEYKIGDVIVYSLPSSPVPIIHRIVVVNADGTYQTKGDNNSGQNPYEFSVRKAQIHGKVIFIIPKLGYFKVVFSRAIGEI